MITITSTTSRPLGLSNTIRQALTLLTPTRTTVNHCFLTFRVSERVLKLAGLTFLVQELIERMERIDAVVVNQRTLRDMEYFNSLPDVRRQNIANYEVRVEMRADGHVPGRRLW